VELAVEQHPFPWLRRPLVRAGGPDETESTKGQPVAVVRDDEAVALLARIEPFDAAAVPAGRLRELLMPVHADLLGRIASSFVPVSSVQPSLTHDPRLARILAELLGAQGAQKHRDPRQGRPTLVVGEPGRLGGARPVQWGGAPPLIATPVAASLWLDLPEQLAASADRAQHEPPPPVP